MTIDTTTKFTSPATKLWEAIPSDTRKILLSNVWCGKCRHEVTITKFSGAVRAGNLLLIGSCSECHGDVAGVIEFGGSAECRHVLASKPRLTEAQALLEVKQLQKESRDFEKRRRALNKKWENGTITKQEKAEMDRLFGKDSDAMISKLIEGARKLAESV